MGCICSARDSVTSESLVHFTSFSLTEVRANARTFDCWHLLTPYLAPADWLSLHLVSRRLKHMTVRKARPNMKLPFASLNSLSLSIDLSTAHEYRATLTPIPHLESPESPRSLHSPFLTGQSLQSLLSNLASRSATPIGFLPLSSDLEEQLRMQKMKIWEDARVGKADAFMAYAQSAKPLADLLDLTFKIDHTTVSLSLLAAAACAGNAAVVAAFLDSLEDLEPDKGLGLERTQVDNELKLDRGAVKKFETRVSPLQFAAAKGFPDIAELLLSAGANPNIGGTCRTDLNYMIKYLERGMPPVLLAAKGLVEDPIELEPPIQVISIERKRDFQGVVEVLLKGGAEATVAAEESLLFYLLKHPSLLETAIKVLFS